MCCRFSSRCRKSGRRTWWISSPAASASGASNTFQINITGARLLRLPLGSLNFSRYDPLDRWRTDDHGVQLENYARIAAGEPYRYGDVLFCGWQPGNAIHSCVYLADDIVYTKNGRSVQPWVLMKLDEVVAFYAMFYQPQIAATGARRTEPRAEPRHRLSPRPRSRCKHPCNRYPPVGASQSIIYRLRKRRGFLIINRSSSSLQHTPPAVEMAGQRTRTAQSGRTVFTAVAGIPRAGLCGRAVRIARASLKSLPDASAEIALIGPIFATNWASVLDGEIDDELRERHGAQLRSS
jgi:hypothetical protein